MEEEEWWKKKSGGRRKVEEEKRNKPGKSDNTPRQVLRGLTCLFPRKHHSVDRGIRTDLPKRSSPSWCRNYKPTSLRNSKFKKKKIDKPTTSMLSLALPRIQSRLNSLFHISLYGMHFVLYLHNFLRLLQSSDGESFFTLPFSQLHPLVSHHPAHALHCRLLLLLLLKHNLLLLRSSLI